MKDQPQMYQLMIQDHCMVRVSIGELELVKVALIDESGPLTIASDLGHADKV